MAVYHYHVPFFGDVRHHFWSSLCSNSHSWVALITGKFAVYRPQILVTVCSQNGHGRGHLKCDWPEKKNFFEDQKRP